MVIEKETKENYLTQNVVSLRKTPFVSGTKETKKWNKKIKKKVGCERKRKIYADYCHVLTIPLATSPDVKVSLPNKSDMFDGDVGEKNHFG